MYLIYIFCCQKEDFYEDKSDQIRELQNGKDNLLFGVITKEAIESKETYCKTSLMQAAFKTKFQ